jgi:tartrate dehydrogenase/decarboxylase/D-malate dehydrogenase
MMLDFLGEKEAGKQLMLAVESVTEKGILTPDLGGKETTTSFTNHVLAKLEP